MKQFLCLIALAIPLVCAAAPMTNDDVIKLVKGGLGEATELQAIDSAEPGFDTSPDGPVKLKQGGVSEAVIQRILPKRAGAPATAPASCARFVRRGREEILIPSLSSVTSKLALRDRWFSFSRSFMRRAWSVLRPSNSLRQRQYICSETPIRRYALFAVPPCAITISASRSLPMISSGPCFLPRFCLLQGPV